jgi:hypothetical protein
VRFPAINRLALAGLVVLALVALSALAWASKPVTVSASQQSEPRSPTSAAVSVGQRACAAPGTAGNHDAGVAVIAATHGGSGQATITRLSTAGASTTGGSTTGSNTAGGSSNGGAPLTRLSQSGALSVSSVPTAPQGTGLAPPATGPKASQPTSIPGGVMIQASGAMAQGFEAEQTGPGGVVTSGCPSPGTDFWFAMPGQTFAGVIRLYLMNVDSQASTVNADIVTDTGPLQTGTDTGINVPAHGMVVQSLAGLVHGSRAIGLHVHATEGRIVAAVSESSRASQPGQWLPAAQDPATHLVIPGLPDSPGTRQLYVSDPGGSDAAVKLSVAAGGGTYEPTGAGSIDIPAGSADLISLPSLSGISGAAVLSANVPVFATMVLPVGQPDGPGAMTAAAPALQEQGVVADAAPRGDDASIVLSAPAAAAKVRLVTGVSGVGSGGSAESSQVVSVPAKRTVTVIVHRPSGANQGFAILLTPEPGSGPVYAGRVLTGRNGTVLDILPVASALTTVPLPGVHATVMSAAP